MKTLSPNPNVHVEFDLILLDTLISPLATRSSAQLQSYRRKLVSLISSAKLKTSEAGRWGGGWMRAYGEDGRGVG